MYSPSMHRSLGLHTSGRNRHPETGVKGQVRHDGHSTAQVVHLINISLTTRGGRNTWRTTPFPFGETTDGMKGLEHRKWPLVLAKTGRSNITQQQGSKCRRLPWSMYPICIKHIEASIALNFDSSKNNSLFIIQW